MFHPETVKFLQSGCALVVGTVDHEGAPHATRGWSLQVLAGDEPRVRLLVDRLETAAVENISTTGVVAITATNVPTLHSMQLKGRVIRTEAANDVDRANAAAFVDAFYADINLTEGTARALLDRMTPAGFTAVEVAVDEFYDQTPGPEAGTALTRGQA